MRHGAGVFSSTVLGASWALSVLEHLLIVGIISLVISSLFSFLYGVSSIWTIFFSLIGSSNFLISFS